MAAPICEFFSCQERPQEKVINHIELDAFTVDEGENTETS